MITKEIIVGLLFILLLVLSAFFDAHADDPGPLAPCYAILSEGAVLMKYKKEGVTRLQILNWLYSSSPTNEQVLHGVYMIDTVYDMEDPWPTIVALHNDCVAKVRYGEGQ